MQEKGENLSIYCFEQIRDSYLGIKYKGIEESGPLSTIMNLPENAIILWERNIG